MFESLRWHLASCTAACLSLLVDRQIPQLLLYVGATPDLLAPCLSFLTTFSDAGKFLLHDLQRKLVWYVGT